MKLIPRKLIPRYCYVSAKFVLVLDQANIVRVWFPPPARLNEPWEPPRVDPRSQGVLLTQSHVVILLLMFRPPIPW